MKRVPKAWRIVAGCVALAAVGFLVFWIPHPTLIAVGLFLALFIVVDLIDDAKS